MRQAAVTTVILLCVTMAGCGGVAVNHGSAVPSGSQLVVSTAPIGSEENPLHVSGGVMAGSVLTKEYPIYPQQARHDHVSGAVVLAVIVDPSGRVASAKVISGPEILRETYTAAVERWTYRPFLLHERPVYVQTAVTMNIAFGAD